MYTMTETDEKANLSPRASVDSSINKELAKQDSASKSPSRSPWYSLVGPWRAHSGDFTATHIAYLVVVLFGVTSTSIFSIPTVSSKLGSVRSKCYYKNATEPCHVKISQLVTFRIGIGLAELFFVLMILLFKVRVTSFRGGIHTGFWLPKVSCLCLLGYLLYLVPHSVIDTIWGYQSIAAWLVFTVIQLAFLVDFSRALSQVLAGQTSTGNQSYWILQAFTATFCTLLVSVVLFLYVFFGRGDKCRTNLILTTVNVIICVVLFVVSSVTAKPRRGLVVCRSILQTSLVSGYILYLTYSALSHEKILCAPDLFKFFESISHLGSYVHSLIGALAMCVLLIYATLRSKHSNHYRFRGVVIATRVEESDHDNQEEFYSCSFVHCVFMLALLYASVTFVSPHELDTVTKATMSWTLLVAKSVASVFVALVYLWILIAPTIYPEDQTNDFLVLLKSFLKFIVKSLYTVFVTGCSDLNQSISTRFIYTFFFFSGTVTCCLMYLPGVRRALQSNAFFCKRISRLGNCMSHDPGYLAVYRVCFSMATFFLLFSIILYAVKNYADPRALIHNGLWIVKFGLFFGLLVCTFFIPLEFSRVWTYTCPVGTFFFTVVQMILIVDLTRFSNTVLSHKAEVTGKRVWFHIIIVATVVFFVISAIAVVCFYVFFVGDSGRCKTNKTFITMNLVLCGIASVVSIHPVVTDTGLFQASAVTIFTMYLTLSGLSYNPNEKCNPLASYISEVDMRPSINIQAVVDLILTIVLLVYFSFRVIPLTKHLRKIAVISFHLICGLRDRLKANGDKEEQGNEVELSLTSDEECSEEDEAGEPVPYSYSFYHFVYFLGSLHVTMVLTNWYTPKDGTQFKLYINWAAMCIKMTASSLCVLLYVWSLIVPILVATPKGDELTPSSTPEPP